MNKSFIDGFTCTVVLYVIFVRLDFIFATTFRLKVVDQFIKFSSIWPSNQSIRNQWLNRSLIRRRKKQIKSYAYMTGGGVCVYCVAACMDTQSQVFRSSISTRIYKPLIWNHLSYSTQRRRENEFTLTYSNSAITEM